MAFSPDSRLLASGGGSDVTVWDFGGERPRGSTPRVLSAHETAVTGLDWSGDGQLLAAVADDGRVAIWEPRTAAPGRAHAPVDELLRDASAAVVRWDHRGHLLTGWADGAVIARAVRWSASQL